MTPEDRRLAREAIERGSLSVDQVAEIRAAAEAEGLSFAEAARRRGVTLASPPPAPPPAPSATSPARRSPFPILLGLSLAVLTGAAVLTFSRAALDSTEQGDAESTARARMEAEKAALRARSAYQRTVTEREAAEAAQALAQARATLTETERRVAGRPVAPPELRDPLLQAAQRFGLWLAAHPDDGKVLMERARAWELYGLPDRARADLEKAVRIDPALAAPAAPALKRLRSQNP